MNINIAEYQILSGPPGRSRRKGRIVMHERQSIKQNYEGIASSHKF